MNAARMLLLMSGGQQAAAPVSPYIVQDTFTDADNTALSAHTIAPVNTAVTSWTVSPSGAFKISSNAVVINAASGNGIKIAYINAGASDVARINSTITIKNSSQSHGIIGRYVDVNNYWMFIYSNIPAFRLLENNAGSFSVRATVNSGVISGDKLFGLSFSGNDIKCYIGGLEVAAYTSSLHATATRFGIFDGIDNTAVFATFKDFEVLK